MHITRHLQKEKYTHNLTLDKKIYAQVISQLVVYTSCTHKFCTNQTYAEKLCDKIYRSKLYIKVMCISYDIFKNRNSWEEKLFRKGKLERRGAPAEPVARWLATPHLLNLSYFLFRCVPYSHSSLLSALIMHNYFSQVVRIIFPQVVCNLFFFTSCVYNYSLTKVMRITVHVFHEWCA
jgi:hypothetical protein